MFYAERLEHPPAFSIQAERKPALEAIVGVPRTAHGSGKDREHVAIAPIAPTILKAGGVDKDEGMLYMTARWLRWQLWVRLRWYGYGEDVSMGHGDAFENFEHGAEVGGLVYQSPNGNMYPWGERDAVRFRMQTEFGMPSPAGSSPRTGQAHFAPSPVPEAEVEQNEDVQMEEVREEQGFKLRPNDVRHRRSKDRGVRLVVLYSNGSMDSVNRRNPPEASAGGSSYCSPPLTSQPSPDGIAMANAIRVPAYDWDSTFSADSFSLRSASTCADALVVMPALFSLVCPQVRSSTRRNTLVGGRITWDRAEATVTLRRSPTTSNIHNSSARARGLPTSCTRLCIRSGIPLHLRRALPIAPLDGLPGIRDHEPVCAP
ncbi:hypothetical protein DFH11DRAFT_1732293 [Phellopilus nigrolimitatus]|nr:hypothetical protein DFH11DRAFT_1732293 [Phellopilus nigrolimitatus]